MLQLLDRLKHPRQILNLIKFNAHFFGLAQQVSPAREFRDEDARLAAGLREALRELRRATAALRAAVESGP